MTNKFDVVEWMAEKAGKTCYRNEIAEFRRLIEVAKTDGDMEHGMKMINMYNEEIKRITREAQDRYDDWASDVDWA